MNDFTPDEVTKYQAEVRKMITDLQCSLGNRWCRWGDWERSYIASIAQKLDQDRIVLSPLQYQKVFDLWERSLR